MEPLVGGVVGGLEVGVKQGCDERITLVLL